jgi:hypothetical protein
MSTSITKRDDSKPTQQSDAITTFAMQHSAGLAAIGMQPAALTENPALAADVIRLYTQERGKAAQHQKIVQIIAYALVDADVKREAAAAAATEEADKLKREQLEAAHPNTELLKSRYDSASLDSLMTTLSTIANGGTA